MTLSLYNKSFSILSLAISFIPGLKKKRTHEPAFLFFFFFYLLLNSKIRPFKYKMNCFAYDLHYVYWQKIKKSKMIMDKIKRRFVQRWFMP
jgi:hypothetical protein